MSACFFIGRKTNVRDFLPDTFDVSDFGLTTQFTFRTNFSSDLLHFGCEGSELLNHSVDGVDEIQHLSGNADARHLGREVTARDCGLLRLNIREVRHCFRE